MASEAGSGAAKRSINFAAGPAKLPESVLVKASEGMLDYAGTGVGVMEMSHRGPEFGDIITGAERRLRDLLAVPDTHSVLFAQGGGTGQFSAVPLNLFGGDGEGGEPPVADYIVTGSWSAKAADEARKYGAVSEVFPRQEHFRSIPDPSTWTLNQKAKYVYYCDNETVHGVEFPFVPETGDVPLVCDMSSNILSRPVDVSKYGVIFAGAQKNIGCAGLTVVIVRTDLLTRALPTCPTVLSYAVLDKAGSMHNTPPTWPIYVSHLVFGWLGAQGGVDAMARLSKEKSDLVYGAVDGSGGFYTAPVDASARSRMNAPFRIKGGDTELEASFVKEAAAKGMLQLKGHRSVGGIRASLYNAVTVDEVKALVAFMGEFRARHA